MKKHLTTQDDKANPKDQENTPSRTNEKPSGNIENAHAAGDGAIGKHSDALLDAEDNTGGLNDEAKKEAEQY